MLPLTAGNFLTFRGFDRTQGRPCYDGDTVTVRFVRLVQRMAKKTPWFTPAVRDIRMLRMEENSDLKAALIDEED
jgi:virulence-associated protein VapD